MIKAKRHISSGRLQLIILACLLVLLNYVHPLSHHHQDLPSQNTDFHASQHKIAVLPHGDDHHHHAGSDQASSHTHDQDIHLKLDLDAGRIVTGPVSTEFVPSGCVVETVEINENPPPVQFTQSEVQDLTTQYHSTSHGTRAPPFSII